MKCEVPCLLQPFVSFHFFLRLLHCFGVLDDISGPYGYRITRHCCGVLVSLAGDLVFKWPVDEKRRYFVRNGADTSFVTIIVLGSPHGDRSDKDKTYRTTLRGTIRHGKATASQRTSMIIISKSPCDNTQDDSHINGVHDILVSSTGNFAKSVHLLSAC